MKSKPCVPCELIPLDSKGREVAPGSISVTGWAYREPPKHGGGCSAEWKGIGGTDPRTTSTPAIPRPDCAPQQNIAPKGSRSAQEPRKSVPGTSGGVKAPKRGKSRK